MRPMRRRSEMPSDEEMMRSQIFQIAYLLGKHKGLVEMVWPSQEINYAGEYVERWFEVAKIVDCSNELHPKVILQLREVSNNVRPEAEEGPADAEEHGEGDVSDSGSDQRLR